MERPPQINPIVAQQSFIMKTIILFERYAGVQFIVERSLKKYQDEIQIISIHDIDEVKRKIDDGGIDLLISELSKHNAEGLEISRYARNRLPDLKIVWITVLGCYEFIEQKIALGIYKCLEKPLEIDKFRADILNALDLVG
jgi:DNA-binding NtrC family response regulator